MLFNSAKTSPAPSHEQIPLEGNDKSVKSLEDDAYGQTKSMKRRATACSPSVSRKGSYSVAGRKQEDRLGCGIKVFEKNGTAVELSLVVDGHGGSQAADFLQKQLPSKIRHLCTFRSDLLTTDLQPQTMWKEILEEAFLTCSVEWDSSATSHAEKRAGAVATIVLIGVARGIVAHVGDGKVVLGSNESFQSLTVDHRASNPSERARIESFGGSVVNNRVRGVLAPSRAFGDVLVRVNTDGTINNDIIRPNPQISSFEIRHPSFLILGTDGLFDVMSANMAGTAVSTLMSSNGDATCAARYLAEHAAKFTEDDISVVILMWP